MKFSVDGRQFQAALDKAMTVTSPRASTSASVPEMAASPSVAAAMIPLSVRMCKARLKRLETCAFTGTTSGVPAFQRAACR